MHDSPQPDSQIYELLQPEPPQHSIIGFTSTLAGEGVSSVARSFAVELAQSSDKQVALVNLPLLEAAGPHCIFKQHTFDSLLDNLWELAVPQNLDKQPTWDGNPLMRQVAFDYLRQNFEVVMLDCPALASSEDILTLAPLLDGVILVVENNRVTREEVLNTQRRLINAQAKLLGIATNDPHGPTPNWLNRLK